MEITASGGNQIKKRPNFIFIISDQHNAKCNGFMNHPVVKTPNLDRIAAHSTMFINAYCGNPVCVPSRSSLITGMYASDTNSFCNSSVYDGSFPTIANRLNQIGYYCWATGKQDLNPELDMGFDEHKVDHDHAVKPDITSLFRRPCIFRVDEREIIKGKPRDSRTIDVRETALAVDFIKNESRNQDKPWFCYVGLHMPHPNFNGLRKYFDYYLPLVQTPEIKIEELESLPLPYQEMRNFKRISTPIPEDRLKSATAAYFSLISEMDENIGQIYDALVESGQLENTYFIYTSDHGESLGEHGMWLKNNLYDVAARVPLMISGPGIEKGKTIEQPVGHIDFTATMLNIAGAENLNELRGISLLPLIEGNADKAPEFVYSESHSEGNLTGSCMVRKGDWKLIHFSYYDDVLFNMKDDPDEKNNLIDDPRFKSKAEELRKLLNTIVDPEEITVRAFKRQEKILNEMVEQSDEEKLFNTLKGRLGDGQASVIVRKLKNISLARL